MWLFQMNIWKRVAILDTTIYALDFCTSNGESESGFGVLTHSFLQPFPTPPPSSSPTSWPCHHQDTMSPPYPLHRLVNYITSISSSLYLLHSVNTSISSSMPSPLLRSCVFSTKDLIKEREGVRFKLKNLKRKWVW